MNDALVPFPADLAAVPRSEHWPKVRREHLAREGWCRHCGGTENLEVHHIKPFHLHPELELDEKNFITLCEHPEHRCHLLWGHGDGQHGDWHKFNPLVRKQCRAPRPAGG